MSVSLIQGKGGQIVGTGQSLSIAFDSDIAAGNVLVVSYTVCYRAPTAGDLTDSRGNTWTLRKSEADAETSASYSVIYTATAKDSGACTVTIDPAGSDTYYIALAISEWSGMSETPENTAGAHDHWTDVHPGNVTISANGIVIGTAEQCVTDTGVTPDANWTATIFNNQTGSNSPGLVLSYRLVSAETYNDGWTYGATRNGAAVSASFLEAAGEGGATTVAKHRGPYMVGMMHGMRKPGMQ